MNKKLIILIIGIFLSTPIFSSHIINFFFKPWPYIVTAEKAKEKEEKIKSPGYLAQKKIRNFLKDRSPIQGIFVTYDGYISASTIDGQVSFPNKQTKPLLYLAVIQQITPILMAGNTIHHWEAEKESPFAFYKIERKEDSETEIMFWEVTEEKPPLNNILPLHTICIIASPKHIYVPLGITITKKSENFLLPDIYVKKGIMNITNALYMLNLKHFFRPVHQGFKQKGPSIIETIDSSHI